MTSMSHQPAHHLHHEYQPMTTGSWSATNQTLSSSHNYTHAASYQQTEASQFSGTLSLSATYQQQQPTDRNSSDNSASSSADSSAITSSSQTDEKKLALEWAQPIKSETESCTPTMPAENQPVSPLYATIHQHHKMTNTTTGSAQLKSPQLANPEQPTHYQSESVYQNRFFGQAQQHQQGATGQCYEQATNYAQDQEQYTNGNAISMQTNHQRHSFNASWPPPAGVSVNALMSPHQQVAVSPQLAGASPPAMPLANQHFQHHQHHQHHHHQQSVSPYSHHNTTTNYPAAQTNGYLMPGSSPISHSAHRLQADSAVLHQHFIGQPAAPAPTHHHHHTAHPHAQLHTQQHYHQPVTQVQLQHHHHHQLHPHQAAEQQAPAPQHFYNHQAPSYYQPHHFAHSAQHGAANVRASVGQQQASNLSAQAKDMPSHHGQMVAKNYSSMSQKTSRHHQVSTSAAMSPSEQQIVRTSSVASSLSSSSPKQAGGQQCMSTQSMSSNFQHSQAPASMMVSQAQQKATGVAGQYCRPQSVSVVSTTSSAASSGSGEHQQNGSPIGAEMSPVHMKREPSESCLAIQNEQMDPTLKKGSQLEQLHQQCASLLDEQQRIPLVSTGAVQHLMSSNSQGPDSKLGSNEANSGNQTPTSANSINNNANNNNGNNTNGRSKRLRTSFKHHQLKEMKKWFSKNQNPDAKDLKTLAQTTGLSKRVLQVWFQNARAKFRRNNAKAVNQQLYNANQHTSHMLQFQQQQAPHHPIHTYGQQHHLNQHTLISHHHHNHHHQQQQQQSHLHGPIVSSATVVAPIAMPTGAHTTPSDSTDHTIQHHQASVQAPGAQSQAHDGTAVVSGGDGCISTFAQLDID